MPNGITFDFGSATRSPAEALIVPLLLKPRPAMQLLSAADKHCDGAVSELVDVDGVQSSTGALGQSTRRKGHRRTLIVSLGEEEKLTIGEVHKAAAAAVRWIRREKVKKVTLWLDGLAATGLDDATTQFAMGMTLAGFRFTELKEPDKKAVSKVRVGLASSESARTRRVLSDVKEANIIGESVNYARLLSHRPANLLNPKTLAGEAQKLGRSSKLKCTVLRTQQLEKLKMNGLITVGRGAEQPACLIRLEYRGAPGVKNHTALVGKAITFDTGGYSLKPTDFMVEMKFDKCGGMAVLGAVKAVAALGLKCNVTAILAAAENAISEKAYRPGDILTMASGKTVEIANTDAEGRLVLADALWYTQKHVKPTRIIDLATLTGGARISLGTAAAAMMSNDDELSAALGEAGRRTHERLWRLPLWDDYKSLIKSPDADIRNSSPQRDAHCIVGGMFLKHFVDDDMPWAHLDIAGVASEKSNATGFGVRLLVEFLRRGHAA